MKHGQCVRGAAVGVFAKVSAALWRLVVKL